MQILFINEDLVIINKPSGVPSQTDPSGSEDALLLTSRELRNRGERDELFLVHRLDRGVGGVMLFARSRQSAAKLSELVRDRFIFKEYLAVVEGDCADGVMEDLLYKDARIGKAFVTKVKKDGAKLAKLTYRAIARAQTDRGVRTLVKISLQTGRFHQIRAQFSSRGLPLSGDGKYGGKDSKGQGIGLFACELRLDLYGGLRVTAFPPEDEYPWSLFSDVLLRGE